MSDAIQIATSMLGAVRSVAVIDVTESAEKVLFELNENGRHRLVITTFEDTDLARVFEKIRQILRFVGFSFENPKTETTYVTIPKKDRYIYPLNVTMFEWQHELINFHQPEWLESTERKQLYRSVLELPIRSDFNNNKNVPLMFEKANPGVLFSALVPKTTGLKELVLISPCRVEIDTTFNYYTEQGNKISDQMYYLTWKMCASRRTTLNFLRAGKKHTFKEPVSTEKTKDDDEHVDVEAV